MKLKVPPCITLGVLLTLGAATVGPIQLHPFGLAARPVAVAYLHMPETGAGEVPRLLSQTGAFTDTRTLTPSASLIPYDLNVAFWSDGAFKTRWMSLPHQNDSNTTRIAFAPTGEWIFPKGTVF